MKRRKKEGMDLWEWSVPLQSKIEWQIGRGFAATLNVSETLNISIRRLIAESLRPVTPV